MVAALHRLCTMTPIRRNVEPARLAWVPHEPCLRRDSLSLEADIPEKEGILFDFLYICV